MSEEETIIQFAIQFANAGYKVFPLYSSSKGPQKPYGWAGNQVKPEIDESKIIPPTSDVDTILEWPEVLRKAYNSELVSYGVLGLNCIIFDLDVKDDKDGSMAFKRLMNKYSIPAPNLVVKSKSGGYHLYYGRPVRFTNSKVKTMANISVGGDKYNGVDVRGDGGMVIGPTVDCDEEDWLPGTYAIIKGTIDTELSQMPSSIMAAVCATSFNDPLDNLASSTPEPDNNEDVLDKLKRGDIPKVLPRGARNQGFYLYINGLRNKGFGPDTVRAYVQKLVDVTEDKDDLHESVDIEEMIARIFEVDINNPYDVARDLINRGLYRVTGHGNKLKYVCYNKNPYFSSINFHDIAALRQLLSRYIRNVPQANGKEKPINPADLIDKIITQDREVDMTGFKPGAESVFTSSDMGGRRFLNTWQDPRILIKDGDIDDSAYDQFLFIVSRIFGKEGTDEFQVGLDLPAWVLQKPGNKPVIVPFVQSACRGVGKSCYMNAMRHVMEVSLDGTYQARTVKIDEIGQRFFNPNGSSLLMLDEVQFPTHRNMRQEATSFWRHLKTLITAPVISVEIKGGSTYEVPCQSAMIMAGNTNNHFPIEEADRRIWIIDNNPDILLKGFADKLFDLDKPNIDSTHKQRIANSIRYWLNKHEIKLDLGEMRAPMNDIKREMFLAGLTDLEAWFLTHFEDSTHIAARSALVTKEMVIYALETSEQMINSKWLTDTEAAFRELRKRGMIQSVRSRTSPSVTRQISGIPNINSHGTPCVTQMKCIVFTSRQHGEFNSVENDFIKQALHSNVQSIAEWREASVRKQANDLTI